MQTVDYSKLYGLIDGYRDNMLQTLDELVSIPSVKGVSKKDMPFGEDCAKVLDKMLSIADDMGFTTKNFQNYVGTIRYNSKEDTLGILCHLDVVPVTAKNWNYPPFKATLSNGNIFGRGTIDDKGPAVSVLYAMKSIKDMGIKLANNVRFIVGCDEENGSSDLEYYSTCESMPPNVFTPDGSYPCINIEKGMIRLSFKAKYDGSIVKGLNGGTVINGVPAECYIVTDSVLPESDNVSIESVDGGYKVKYTGLSGHASTPELANNGITGLFEYLSKYDTSKVIHAINSMFPHGDYNGRGLGIFTEDTVSGKVTCVLSMISMQDDYICGKVDIRFPINTTKEDIIRVANDTMHSHGIELEVLMAENPHHTNEDSDFIKTLLNIYAQETGNTPYCKAIGGGTYVHNIDGGVAFGAEFPDDENNMHGDDEHISLDSLILNTKMFARAIIEVCGTE